MLKMVSKLKKPLGKFSIPPRIFLFQTKTTVVPNLPIVKQEFTMTMEMTMEIHILSHNYRQIHQSCKNTIFCLRVSKLNSFGSFPTVLPWPNYLTTSILKQRLLQICLCFLWKLDVDSEIVIWESEEAQYHRKKI